MQEKEVLKSSVEDTHQLRAVTGRCAVLPGRDYVACRYTEVGEKHVYVCDSRYVEAEKAIKKFLKPMSQIKVYCHSYFSQTKSYNPFPPIVSLTEN